MVAVGFAATVFFAESVDTDEQEAEGRHRSGADPDGAQAPEESASLDDVLSGQAGR